MIDHPAVSEPRIIKHRTPPTPPTLLMRAPVLFPAMSNRTPNFTLEQKLYLLQRMQGVVETVQDFRKDTNTTAQRNAVWEQLARAFNAAFPDRPPSTTGSLKTLWKRLKVECRAALHRRQEQLAAGLSPVALTQVQREVTALVPNLISNKDDLDGEMGYTTAGKKGASSPVTVAGTSGSDQEEVDHNEELDSKEQLAINLGLTTSTTTKEQLAINLGLTTTTTTTSSSHVEQRAQEPSRLSPDHDAAPISTHHTRLRTHNSQHDSAGSGTIPRPPALFYPSHTQPVTVTSSSSSLSRHLGTFEDSALELRGVSRVCEPRVEGTGGGEVGGILGMDVGMVDGGIGAGGGGGSGYGGSGGTWDEHKRELCVLEHEQTMRLLALQECVWECKRRAATQKEKAARAKKHYYRAKLKKMGAELPTQDLCSSDDSSD